MRAYYPGRLENILQNSKRFPDSWRSGPLMDVLRRMDNVLRDLSAQNVRSNSGLSAASTAGNVSSLAKSGGGTKRTGDVTFTAGAAITLVNATNDFSWAVDTTALPPLIADTPAITYGTAYGAGTALKFPRTDSVLVYPEALGTAAARTKNLTLTEDAAVAGFGAVLTASSTFSTNKFLSFYAPTGVNPFSIGRLGNFCQGGVAPQESFMMSFVGSYGNNTITDGSEVGAGCRFMDVFLTNSSNQDLPVLGGVGSSSNNYSDTTVAITPPTATPWNNNTKYVAAWGGRITFGNTKYGSNTSMYYQTGAIIHTAGIGSPTVPRMAIFHAFSPQNSAAAGKTVSQISSFAGNDLNEQGNSTAGVVTRRSLVEQMATWTCGTTKRSLDAFNTAEVKSFDFLTSTQGKGFMCKDAQGSPHYWRYTVATDGTPSIEDTGTTAPAS